MFEKTFKLKENGTDVKTEILAGMTTFMAMAYIICVQPVILSKCGMDFGAVMMATCLSSAPATGRGKEVHWVVYIFAVLFILRYILL